MFKKNRFVFNFTNEWAQLFFKGFNWYTFTLISIDFESDVFTDGYEFGIILLGFGIRVRYNTDGALEFFDNINIPLPEDRLKEMKQEIEYNKFSDSYEICIDVPAKLRGEYTYGGGEWVQDGVCVFINDRYMEYSLNMTNYLDYKDSLQSTRTICFFDSKKEAVEFADKYKLMIEYAH